MKNSAPPADILVIDDDQAVRESLAFYLEDHGYNIRQAASGQEGITLFEQYGADAVMVDLRMPGISGHEVLEHIAAVTQDIPLIVISGTGQIDETVKALRLGAWDFIMKPITDMGILRHSLLKGLERARLLKENRAYQNHLEEEVRRRTSELQRSEQQLRAVFEAAVNVAFVTTDLAGAESRILSFSPGAEKLFALPAAEAVGKPISILYPNDSISEMAQMQEQLRNGKKGFVGEQMLRHSSGSLFPALHTLHPLYNDFGQLNQALLVSIDLSDRKKTEEKLNHKIEELIRFNKMTVGREKRIIELKRTINNLLKELGREEKYRSPEMVNPDPSLQ
jgi:PAS domain S-box-containing protein